MLNRERHYLIMVQILKDVYQEISIAPLLGFKGGTAAYLFYKLPRFSVDLDFNFLSKRDQDETLVQKKIIEIIQHYGDVRNADIKKHTIFFLLSYGKGERNLKIEISRRPNTSEYELKTFLGIPMLVMKPSFMFAHKLVALTDRKNIASRDIFDIWFFLKQLWDIEEDVIKERTGSGLLIHLEQCIATINKLPSKDFLQGLGELVDEKTKHFVKTKLKEEVIFLLKAHMN